MLPKQHYLLKTTQQKKHKVLLEVPGCLALTRPTRMNSSEIDMVQLSTPARKAAVGASILLHINRCTTLYLLFYNTSTTCSHVAMQVHTGIPIIPDTFLE